MQDSTANILSIVFAVESAAAAQNFGFDGDAWLWARVLNLQMKALKLGLPLGQLSEALHAQAEVTRNDPLRQLQRKAAD